MNTTLLDRALSDASGAGELFIKQGEAVADRVAAEGRGIENAGVAKRNFQTAYGAGLKIGLISVGVGLAALLVMVGASYVIDALRRPYSTSAFDALVNENSALLEKVRKLSLQVADPPAKVEPLVAEPTLEGAVKTPEQRDIGIATAALALDPNSVNCPENRSFSARCEGSHRYNDGRTYHGQWLNGLPDGQGKFTLANGSIIEGTWKTGFPSEIKNQQQAQKALKTIYIFTSLPEYDLGNDIDEVIVGHVFADGNSAMWLNAYCYLNLSRKSRSIGTQTKIELSRYDKPEGPLTKENYTSALNGLISRANFTKAQSDCPYQFNGFR
jgi:hypothetical protein